MVKLATLTEYKKLLDDRPEKFTSDQVDYRDSDGKEKCVRCFHMYKRVLDQHGVCEIFRSPEVDEDGLDPNYVCDFFTHDGETHPLLEKPDA